MKKIFVVNGAGGVGKTTFENIVQDVIYDNNMRAEVAIFSIIDYIKQIALEICWDGNKDLRGRKFLSQLKDSLAEYDDIPYKKLKEKIDNMPNNAIIFVDSREQEDIKRLVNDYKAKTVLVMNSLRDSIIYGNHADDNVNNYNYDIYIDNCGTLNELREKAFNFYNNYII